MQHEREKVSRIRKLLLVLALAITSVVPLGIGTAGADHNGTACSVYFLGALYDTPSPISWTWAEFNNCSSLAVKGSCVSGGDFMTSTGFTAYVGHHGGAQTVSTNWNSCGPGGSTTYFGTVTRSDYHDQCVNYTILSGWGSWYNC